MAKKPMPRVSMSEVGEVDAGIAVAMAASVFQKSDKKQEAEIVRMYKSVLQEMKNQKVLRGPVN